MKIKFENLQLSGKGIIVSGEYHENNLKLTFENTEFQEVVAGEGESRVGWYINDEFSLLADFTVHTKKGMVGESFDYTCKLPFVRESDKIISALTDGILQDVNIELTEPAFKKMFRSPMDLFSGDFNLDPSEDSLLVISTVSEVIHVQTDEESINVSTRGVYVLKLAEDKLSIVSQKHGITVVNDNGKTVRIGGHKGIEIDGMDFDFNNIARQIKDTVRDAFTDMDF